MKTFVIKIKLVKDNIHGTVEYDYTLFYETGVNVTSIHLFDFGFVQNEIAYFYKYIGKFGQLMTNNLAYVWNNGYIGGISSYNGIRFYQDNWYTNTGNGLFVKFRTSKNK